MDGGFVRYSFDAIDDRPVVVAIGSFDGVHKGHRVLLDHLRSMSERLGARSVVVTFDPHPRIAMGRDGGMGLITTIEERALLLREAGIDNMVVAHFDEKFRSQGYEEFVERSLVAGLGMCGMIVGYNHRLGRGSEGNYERLMPLAERCGFALECVAQHRVDDAKVSSTVVRNVIRSGDMAHVKSLLGGDYVVMGVACEGIVHISDSHKLLPPCGDYVATVNEKTATITIDNRSVTLSEPLSGGVVIRF